MQYFLEYIQGTTFTRKNGISTGYGQSQSYCPIGIMIAAGGDELIVGGDDTPLTAIVIGFRPAAMVANCCGAFTFIWN